MKFEERHASGGSAEICVEHQSGIGVLDICTRLLEHAVADSPWEVHARAVPPELPRLPGGAAAGASDDGLARRADAAGGLQPQGSRGRPLAGSAITTVAFLDCLRGTDAYVEKMFVLRRMKKIQVGCGRCRPQ